MPAPRHRRPGRRAALVALLLVATMTAGAVADVPAVPGPGIAAAAEPAADRTRTLAADPCVEDASQQWPITRLSGPDRYATAACVARAGYPDGAETVLLARGDAAGGFADALAGTVLARTTDAPVLLTGPTSLDPATRDAIATLAPQHVVVLGGSVAVADGVVAKVRRLVPEVSRLAGQTRFGTAARIAEQVPGAATFVVNGRRPADALTAGAAAARAGAALLLTETDAVPDETRAALRRRDVVTVVGGTGVVSGRTERTVRRIVDGQGRRLGGGTRYETAATVARAHPGDGTIHLVSGADGNLVDAIAAGWLAAMPGGGPVVYTTRETPDRATDRYLRLGPLAGTPVTRVLGGTVSIADTMVAALEQRYEEARDGGPPAQLRAMWVHLFDRSLKTRGGIERALDTAAAANLNTVIVQGTRRHDAYYDSDVLPPTTDPQLEAGLDVLGTLIPAAHARGLRVHVWWSVTPSTHPSMQDEVLPADHVNTVHGVGGSGTSWVVPGWTPGYEYLDPGVPGFQRHVVAMVREVVQRYDVDGVHLDYLRYPCLRARNDGTCVADTGPGDDASPNQNDITVQRWRQHGDGQPLADFLRAQTEDLTRRVMLEVATVDPSVVVSGALVSQGQGPTGESLRRSFQRTKPYYEKGQDWLAWLEGGLLDHAFPMAYFREADATYATWHDQWARFADRVDTPRFVTALGQAGFLNCVGGSLSQLRQSTTTLDGAAVYSYQADVASSCPGQSRGDLFRALSAPGGLFATPAPVPAVPRRDAPRVGHVIVAAADGDRVELVPDDAPATRGRVVRADATGHAGFVDVPPGTWFVGVEGGSGVDGPIEVRAGRVTRVR